jgi:hypothetical protein
MQHAASLYVKNLTNSHHAAWHATYNARHTAQRRSFYIKVIGTNGAARYSYNDWVVNAKHIVHSHTYVPYSHTIHAEDRHFVEETIAHGRPPLSSIDDAITALQIIEAVELSIRESRHVRLPQPVRFAARL